jgi:inhibitor of cysteine peptidase
MRRSFWAVLAFILLASLCVGVGAACSGNSASLSGSGNDVNVDSSYSGKQVELSVGQSLVVTLESNATTGYSWALVQNSDEAVLNETGNQYIAPQTTLVGAGGKEEWTFKALKKGTSTISMGYSRPWESTPPIETFDLTVVVK